MTRQLGLDLDPPLETPSSKRSEEQCFLEWASGEWGRVHERIMTVRWARDLAIVRPLLRLHGADELKARWLGFIRTMDEYFARRGWDIPTFCANVDRYWGQEDRVVLVQRAIRRRRRG
jgi:hypothetical protein